MLNSWVWYLNKTKEKEKGKEKFLEFKTFCLGQVNDARSALDLDAITWNRCRRLHGFLQRVVIPGGH